MTMDGGRPYVRASSSPSTARAIIDSRAIAHNVKCLLKRLEANGSSHRPSLWAVAKADAYGHGIAHAVEGFREADGIAVLSLADAYAVRALGWTKALLILDAGTSTFRSHIDDPALYPLHIIIDSPMQIAQMEVVRRTLKPFIWLRHAGALHHAGLESDQYFAAWNRLQALAQAGRIQGVGQMQHYARAEEFDRMKEERKAFEQAISPLRGPRCTENSAALLLDSGHARPGDWVRSGIALYGISPLPNMTATDLGLQPAMHLQAPITATRQLPAGSPLGYGATFHAGTDMRIGLVACGYACGYPRNLAENCPVIVNGRFSRVVGRVAMNCLTIDLTGHPDAEPGTMVTLWGANGLPIETVAQYAGTIPAQLCSGLTAQVVRQAACRQPR